MYLKNLTVLGFKSFADRTSLNFQPGVTAIVGPNGCGKSNVSDAIRWVLGEQSAKALRGGEMADVIFNGTDGRKPLGMAEVSITLGGVDAENLSAAGVAVAYHEVTVTRRVFRDGGSEYFINRTPCRLKDIQQLFMGTGIGRTSYSIMAQGNITQILSSKPEDRRMVFEEAAGITKFKSQKKESLRKLEYTEQNLLRVADLIREVKRQIGSLQRQAGKARRFKQIQIELQHLDTQLARHQLDVLLGEVRDRQTAADNLRNEIETESAAVLRAEDEIAQLRERLSELEHEVAATQQRGLELKSEMDRHESRIQFNEERLREFAAQNTKATADITEAEERNRFASDELASVRTRMSASETALAQHKQTLHARQASLQQIENGIRGGQDELRSAQSEAFAVAQDLTRARNEINALDLQKSGNVVRLEKLSAEKIQLEEERSGLEARLNAFATNVESDKLSVATKRGSVEQRQARLKELQGELQQSSTEQDQLLQQQARQAGSGLRFGRRIFRRQLGKIEYPVHIGFQVEARALERDGGESPCAPEQAACFEVDKQSVKRDSRLRAAGFGQRKITHVDGELERVNADSPECAGCIQLALEYLRQLTLDPPRCNHKAAQRIDAKRSQRQNKRQ